MEDLTPKKVQADADYSQETVPEAGRKGFWPMFFIMLGFTFFSASMSVGAKMGNGSNGAEKRGFWQLLWRSWWLLPVLHVTLFWGGCAATAATGMACEAVPGLDKHELWALVFGISWLLGLATAALLPVVVVVQLARREWKTALATVLFSAVVLAPFAWLIWKLQGLRGLC